MNIVYSSSDSYAEIAGISILSLFEHNTDIETIIIYMIDNNISNKNKQNLEEICRQWNRTIVYVTNPDIAAMAGTDIDVGMWNISTFSRLFIPSMLPPEAKRAIYIDCDAIILDSLKPLWELDLGTCSVAGVDDCRSGKFRENIGLQADSNYINNGVLLIDLEKWRKKNVEKQFLNFLNQHNGKVPYVDQGVLNGTLSEEIYLLHPRYNAMTMFFDFNYENLIKFRKPTRHNTKKEYAEAVKHPCIVHFTTCFLSGLRPWIPGCTHPYTNEFLKYKKCSPWKDVPLRSDERNLKSRTVTKVCRKLPIGVVVSVSSLVHSKVLPVMQKLFKTAKI